MSQHIAIDPSLEPLVVAIERAWHDADDLFERHCWNVGAIVYENTRGLADLKRDALLRAVAERSRPGERGVLHFDFLVELYLLRERFPHGPPPLSWQHIRHLLRVQDATERQRYAHEAESRLWTENDLGDQINAKLFSKATSLEPVWTVAVGEVVAVAQSRDAQFLVERVLVEGAPAESPPMASCATRVRIVRIDQAGSREELGVIDWNGGSCAILDDAFYVTSASGLCRYQDGVFRLLVPSEFELAVSPIASRGRIISLWNRRLGGGAGLHFRIAVSDGEIVRWSELLAGRCGGLQSWILH